MRCRLFLLLLVLLTGCSSLLNLEEPDYSLRSITTTPRIAIPLRESTIDFEFLVEIRNPNELSITLDQIDFDLLLNRQPITRSVSAQDVRIPANGIGNATLRTSVNYESVRTLFNEIVESVERREADYELRGRAWFQTPIGRMSFPVTVRGRELL